MSEHGPNCPRTGRQRFPSTIVDGERRASVNPRCFDCNVGLPPAEYDPLAAEITAATLAHLAEQQRLADGD